VVGGGNAGVEAAQSLAKPEYGNKVILAVRGRNFDRCHDENQNIIRKMESEGLVQIWFQSQVFEIHPDSLIVNKNGESVQIANDYLFVFAGTEMPQKFLMSLGVEITKKFGEALAISS
jgi:thioredoxin reductase